MGDLLIVVGALYGFGYSLHKVRALDAVTVKLLGLWWLVAGAIGLAMLRRRLSLDGLVSVGAAAPRAAGGVKTPSPNRTRGHTVDGERGARAPGECQTVDLRAILPTGDVVTAAGVLPPALAARALDLLRAHGGLNEPLHALAVAYMAAIHDTTRDHEEHLATVFDHMQQAGCSPRAAMAVVAALTVGMTLGIDDEIPTTPEGRIDWIQRHTALVRLGMLFASLATAESVRAAKGIHA